LISFYGKNLDLVFQGMVDLGVGSVQLFTMSEECQKFDESIFLFFSVSVQSLMTLAYETLHEACTSSQQCAVQLFYTCRNMFELFSTVVPTYHRDSVTKLPQVAGKALYL
jgi:hypothetical protein